MEPTTQLSSHNTSLDPMFIPLPGDMTTLKRMSRRKAPMSQLRHEIAQAPFNAVYDYFRATAIDYMNRGEIDAAIDQIKEINSLITRAMDPSEEEGPLLDTHAALLQILTSLYIKSGNEDAARATAAEALTLLSMRPKRRDEPFLVMLSCLLFDIACIHVSASQFKQAERELEKSLKLLERLARTNGERYAPAHVVATAAATQVYRNRVKQANLLAHYQVATSTYLSQVNQGIETAVGHLAESLFTEGQTLANMGRHREAITYFTRALKYYTRLNPNFDLRQLEMSIALGRSLLAVNATRDKGIHLLNTMLHKATKINATAQHRAIVDILAETKSRRLDILDIWHKVFPR